MLRQLADAMGTSIAGAGLLMTVGAIVLCFGSPLMAWATSGMERRSLLAGCIGVLAIGHAASMLAPNFAALLGIRVVSMIAAAPFTPLAASTVSLIVPERERSSAITFVFLGWSLAIAGGLPIVTSLASHLGWREAYGALAAAGAVSGVLLVAGLPKGLYGAPVQLASWAKVFHSRVILLLLMITALAAAGQFLVFTYLGPLLAHLAGAGPTTIALFFAGFGVTGFIGNLVATRIVGRTGVYPTSLACFLIMLCGALVLAFGAGTIAVMAIGVLVWGLGFASSNSIQQARLVATAPELASATVALNTSCIYVGQAVGSGVGGLMFAHDRLLAMGFVASALISLAVVVVLITRPAGLFRVATSSSARSAR
jgi:predicted MFS family arabinose efflux permease